MLNVRGSLLVPMKMEWILFYFLPSKSYELTTISYELARQRHKLPPLSFLLPPRAATYALRYNFSPSEFRIPLHPSFPAFS